MVNPGSILARVKRVLTTSSLFIYNCKHRSIRFWTYKHSFCRTYNHRDEKWISLTLSRTLFTKEKHNRIKKVEKKRKGCKNKLNWYPYKFDILAWYFLIVVAWRWYWSWISSRSLICLVFHLVTLWIMYNLVWWLYFLPTLWIPK